MNYQAKTLMHISVSNDGITVCAFADSGACPVCPGLPS